MKSNTDRQRSDEASAGADRLSSRRLLSILLAALFACFAPAVAASDKTPFCNAVQNKVGFIRYPLGMIGAWSNVAGETADVMTRVPRIYPCIDRPAARHEKDDWRASVTGDPSLLSVKYRADKPSGASEMAITVSPHVSVFKVGFPTDSRKKYVVLDFTKTRVDDWARLYKWTERTVTRVDDRTFHATVSEPGKKGAFYVIRFSAPSAASGSLDSSGQAAEGVTRVTGDQPLMYLQFDAPTVTVAIAESFTSLEKAEESLAAEYSDFDSVQKRCHAAWNEVLNRVEVQGSDSAKRMAYTALYTMYVNVVDGGEGYYAGSYPRARSVASSAYWQFIGGYHSCCWDNIRATYPFLILSYPEVMTDVVNTYLARYQLDGCMDGDICLFAGPSGHNNIRFTPALMAHAYYGGLPVDYSRIYGALKDNYTNEKFTAASLRKNGHLVQPESGGFACSRSLEFHTGFHAMALLAKVNQDESSVAEYLGLSNGYTKLWDSSNKAFRVKDADGNWGPIANSKMTWNPNPQGLFEGTTRDWAFFVPHDPYGLLNLPGQDRFVERVSEYCLNNAWFNDYQYVYPYLLYYAGAANEAQKIIRDTWVPLFNQGIMYEGVKPKPPHGGWQTHYAGVSGWLMCSMLGLYPSSAPAGQYFISSPSITKAVIRNGKRAITVEARNNHGDNIYVRSIKVDGKAYPAYMIPSKRLAGGTKIELDMGSDPKAGLGALYISSSDGFVQSAELSSGSRLKCVIEAPVGVATTKIHSDKKPRKVVVNGRGDKSWNYDEAKLAVSIQTTGTSRIEVWSR